MKKRVLWALLGMVCAVALIFVCTAVSILQYGKQDHKQKADVAVVLGAAATDAGVSPVYRERLNHAIWLYQNGYADYLLTTGGTGDGNQNSDGELARQYLISQGIPEEVIFKEERSTITEENLKFAGEIMAGNGLDTCILVSDPLHMKRAMLMAEDFGLAACSSPTPTTRYQSIKTKLPFLAREVVLYLGYWILRPFR